jgi:hypothetical protein
LYLWRSIPWRQFWTASFLVRAKIHTQAQPQRFLVDAGSRDATVTGTVVHRNEKR